MRINLINLVGRVGSDPDVKYLESGAIVCKLSLAVNRRTKDSEPDWFNVELWGKNAEVAEQHVKKGSLIGISGSLDFNQWEDADQNQRSSPFVKANRLDLLGSKKED